MSHSPLLIQRALFAGQWQEAHSGAMLEVVNPANGERIGYVPALSIAETREAIAFAQGAMNAWKTVPAPERSRLLRCWFEAILDHSEELARILTMEQGKPLAEARGEIAYGASYVEWFSEEAKRLYGEVIPALSCDRRLIVLREPVGVCAAITPWNFPNAMVTRKVAPALAAGCAVLVKPAPQTPFSALALARLAEEAGLPPGLISVLTGSATEIGGELCRNPTVRKLTFTGSTPVGKLLMKQCADTVKKVTLELGGNAPFIVFEDADLDAAVEGCLVSKFRNAGQTCVCSNRIYVHHSVQATFSEKLARAVDALVVGPGCEDGVTIGPLIDQQALNKVDGLVSEAVAAGATLLRGGRKHSLGGAFYEPTILSRCTSGMRIAQEEIFGPVAPIISFGSEEEVIRLANETSSGLAGYFYSRDLARTWRVASALETGMVGINTGLISNAMAPFGGVKESGIGREGSRHGIDDYLNLKYLAMAF